ncbi:MAG: methyltransferase domain-containing protein [Pseudomonadota bacterium]
MPRCVGCLSLERHRAYRLGFAAISPWFERRQALQFSDDPAIPRHPFTTFEVSQYGGPNSLDLQSIDRENNAYDMVIANHVLEHVADDFAALKELDRVCSDTGVVALSVPDLLRIARTSEYGRRRDDKHGHYRVYGPDIVERFEAAVPSWSVLAVTVADPVTGAPDRLNFLSRSVPTLETLCDLLRDAMLAPRFVLNGPNNQP